MPRTFTLTKWLVRSGIARYLPLARRRSFDAAEYLHYYSDVVLAAPVEDLLDRAAFPFMAEQGMLNLNEPAPRSDSPVSSGWAADRSGPPPAWGLPELRGLIADQYKTRGIAPTDPNENVFITHGATGAFTASLAAFVNPGDRVVLFSPCSPMFAVGAKSRRATVRWVPTTTDEGRLRFDPAALATAVRGAKMLVLSDPGNPTGGTLDPEDQERIAWLAVKHDFLIYLDESFAKLRYHSKPNRLGTMTGADRRTLMAGSVTPGLGLSSVRVGWLVGPRPLVQACALTATLSVPYVPTVCQRVAARALAAGDDLFAPVIEQFQSRVRFTRERLLGMGLPTCLPAGGYFLWVSLAGLGTTGREFTRRMMAEQRVLVGPGEVYGPGNEEKIRLSVACEEGRLREGLSRLQACVDGLRGKTVVQAVQISNPSTDSPVTEVEPVTAVEPKRRPSFSRV